MIQRYLRGVVAAACASSLALVLASCAGGGDGGDDSASATGANLREPAAVAVDANGAVYIGDTGNCRVVRLVSGSLEPILGDGACAGDSVDVNGLAFDAQGMLYVADASGCRVLRWFEGETTAFAGDGTCGFGGDGGPATEAQLDHPAGLAVDANGRLYIADARNCRIRMVTDGTITTLAGVDRCGYEGDGGPAAAAALDDPVGVAVGSDASVYIVEAGNCRVRRIRGGQVDTIAGDGSCVFGEPVSDPATAGLGFPRGVALAPDGTLLVADTHGCRLLALEPDAISVEAGDGTCGYGGDGGPALGAQFDLPAAVALAPDGTLYVADTQNCRIRAVRDGTVTTVAGSGCE